MKKSRIFGLLFCLLSTKVFAGLVEHDWLNSGDSLITYDNASGLEWLDLTVTRGWSVGQTIDILANNSLYSGWRMAEQSEVKNLFEHVLFTDFTFDQASFPGNVIYGTGTREQGLLMTSLFGNTAPQYEAVSYGIASIGDNLVEFHGSFVSGTDNRLYHNDTLDNNFSYSQAGVFLVRGDSASVPESAPVTLFALGLAAMLYGRRRRS